MSLRETIRRGFKDLARRRRNDPSWMPGSLDPKDFLMAVIYSNVPEGPTAIVLKGRRLQEFLKGELFLEVVDGRLKVKPQKAQKIEELSTRNVSQWPESKRKALETVTDLRLTRPKSQVCQCKAKPLGVVCRVVLEKDDGTRYCSQCQVNRLCVVYRKRAADRRWRRRRGYPLHRKPAGEAIADRRTNQRRKPE